MVPSVSAGAVVVLADEGELDFAGPVQVRSHLPVRSDVPAERDGVRRVEGKDSTPAADRAVDPTVVDVTSEVLLQDVLSDRNGKQVVLTRFDLVQVGELPER